MNQNGERLLNNEEDGIRLPTITLPWIPGVSPKLRKVYKKAGYKAVFKSNANLQTILTARNKGQSIKNSHPGVYKIPCACEKVPPYIGQTKLQVHTRADQHKGYVRKAQWEKSGAAKHARNCPTGPLFDDTETIKIVYNTFDRRVRESLEIQKHASGPKEGGINLDDGMYVKTKFWLPFMNYINKHEKKSEHTNKEATSNQSEDNIMTQGRQSNADVS